MRTPRMAKPGRIGRGKTITLYIVVRRVKVLEVFLIFLAIFFWLFFWEITESGLAGFNADRLTLPARVQKIPSWPK